MSLLDQNWGAGGSADDEGQDDNQTGRQVIIIIDSVPSKTNQFFLFFFVYQ